MGIDLVKLKKAIQRAGYNYSDMGEKLGITRSAFSKKMSGVNDFETSQTWEIGKILNLSAEEMDSIFFSQCGDSEKTNTAPLTPYGEDGFKEAKVVVKKDSSLVIEPIENQTEKSGEEIALISKDVINLLAEKKCTVEEAYNVLRITQKGIEASTVVRKLEY